MAIAGARVRNSADDNLVEGRLIGEADVLTGRVVREGVEGAANYGIGSVV